MIKKVKISYMTYADIDDVCKLEAAAYGQHHWSRESFINEIENNLARYYTLRNENDELLGYLGTWMILDEAHVTTLAVSNNFKRQKVAQLLLTKFIDDCYTNKIKYITLEVRVSNEPAKKLYEKFGFHSLGTRKGYYQDNNEDALIMWTENIWYDKYKMLYNQITEELRNIEVEVEP